MIIRQLNRISVVTMIGIGPANIIAIAHLLARGMPPKLITAIGDQKGGAFANELSAGSSVPGNTRADGYKNMYEDLYKFVPTLRPPKGMPFTLDLEKDDCACSLDVAAGPLRYITEKICGIVDYRDGRATSVKKTADGYQVEIKLANSFSEIVCTQQVVLGIGGKPRVGKLPQGHEHVTILNPNDVFIKSTVRDKFVEQKLTVAIIGSSHSAALATINLLEQGHSVVQFMDKEYLYAETITHPDGSKTTKHDDTGLKGDVARKTKILLKDLAESTGPYQGKHQRHMAKNRSEVDLLLQKYLKGCTHAVFTIGYDPAQTLEVEGLVLARENHDSKTMQFRDMPGLYGFGLAFAQIKNGAQSNGLTKYHASAKELAPQIMEYAKKKSFLLEAGLFGSHHIIPISQKTAPTAEQLRSAL